MANRFVVALVRLQDEDDFLRETWKSIVMLKKTYVFHASKIKQKAKKKSNAKKAGVARIHSRNCNQVPSGQVEPTAPPSEFIPPLKKDIVDQQTTTTTTVSQSSKKVTASQLIPDKSWAEITSPSSKQITPSVGAGNPHPAPEKKAEKEDRKKPAKKISISSSSSSDAPPQKKPASKTKPTDLVPQPKGKWDIDRERWIKRRVKLEEKGADLSAIRTGRADLYRWDGISTKSKDKKTFFYVVWRGKKVGIFVDWDSASKLVSGVSGSGFKKITGSEREAIQLLEEKLED